MKKHNIGFDIEKQIQELPPGIDRSILRILKPRIGRDNSILGSQLLRDLDSLGFHVDSRIVRLTINQLRKQGHLICSTGGINGGYWLAADWPELEAFIDGELHSRAMDLLETEKILRGKAEEVWGQYSAQFQLFPFTEA